MCAVCVIGAATEPVAPVSMTLSGIMSDRMAAMAQVLAGLQRLQFITPIVGTLYRSALIEVAMLPAGVVNGEVSLPSTDVALAGDEAVTIMPTVS